MSKLTEEQIEFGKNHFRMTNLTEEYIPLPAPDRKGFSDVFYQVAHGFDISGYSKEQLDIFSNNGYHLIHIAAFFNNIKALEHLINLGIDIKTPDLDFIPSQAIHFAARNGLTEIVELLIENGADIQAEDIFGDQLIYFAAWYGRLEIVALLIEKGANIHAFNKLGQQAIHIAALNGHKEVVELLLQNGADIHATDNGGDQPIHLAAKNGHKKIVELLMQKEANIHAPNKGGLQPIHLAAREGYKETVELLLKNRANIHAVNNQGQQPIHDAAEQGHKEIVELFIKEYKKSKKENELNTLLTSNNFAFFTTLLASKRFYIENIKKFKQVVFPIFTNLYKLLDDKQKIALEEKFKNDTDFEFFKEALNISRKITIDIENVISLMIELTSVDKTYPEMETIITKKTDDIYYKLKATTQDPDKFVDYESLELATKLTLTAERINIPEYPNEVLNHIFAYITGNDAINFAAALNINRPIQEVSVNDIGAPDQTPDIAMPAAKNQNVIK